jgi:hypothetical protein
MLLLAAKEAWWCKTGSYVMAGWLEVLGITISKPHVARVPEHQPHSSDHCMIGPCHVTASNFSTTNKHSPIIDIASSVAIPVFKSSVKR